MLRMTNPLLCELRLTNVTKRIIGCMRYALNRSQSTPVAAVIFCATTHPFPCQCPCGGFKSCNSAVHPLQPWRRRSGPGRRGWRRRRQRWRRRRRRRWRPTRETLPNGARHLVARVDGIDAKGLQVHMAKRQAEGVVPSHCAVSAWLSPMSIYQNIASRSQATGIHCKAKAPFAWTEHKPVQVAASSDAFITYTSHRNRAA